jgi:hypothetical protein
VKRDRARRSTGSENWSVAESRKQSRPLKSGTQTDVTDMSVNGGGRDVLVTEQSLQETEVYPILEEQGRAGMTQHVRSYVHLDTAIAGELPKGAANCLGRPRHAVRAEEAVRVLARRQSCDELAQFHIDDEHLALAPAFAADVEPTAFGVEVRRP